MNTCPECGAEASIETSCQTRFDECLAKEFSDTSFGAVHHLTVTAYMLQHSSKLSKEGWLEMRSLLDNFLVKRISPDQARLQYTSENNHNQRTIKITSSDGCPLVSNACWTKTILSVRFTDSDTYCADITSWARAVLMDSLELAL